MIGVFALCEPGSRTSYATACTQMFEWIGTRFGMSDRPAISGLSRTRDLVTQSELERVWQRAASWSEDRLAPIVEALPGYRLIAVDGSGVIMPRSASTSAAFGIRRNSAGEELCHYPEGLLVSAWDVERRLPLAWRLVASAAKGGERLQFLNFLEELPLNSVLLLDRGYPSREVLGKIHITGRKFVVRMIASECGSWPEIQEFIKSNEKSANIEIALLINGERKNVTLRAVRRSFSVGRPQSGQKRQTMVLLSNLVEPSITDKSIINFYAKRWVIETIHDEMKNLTNLETWHSKSTQGIQQELLCRMLWHLFVGYISSHLESERQAIDPETSVRTNSARVIEAAREITNYLFESINTHPAVKIFLRNKAERRLNEVRKQIVKRRKRKSRPRIPLHPHAKPR